MVEFSVIVPVFNCECYLGECIESILNQSYGQFELLLIDDGSTDGSLSVCRNYEKKDRRIRVFSKQNQGLLLTRRFALPLANKDWIVFVDADDYIDQEFLLRVEKTISNNANTDLVLIRSKTISNSGKFLWNDASCFSENRIFETEKDFEDIFCELAGSFNINALWKKIAKKQIYDIETDYTRFGKVKGEDLLQSIPLLNNAKKIVYLDEAIYFYRLSDSGLGRNLKAKYYDDFVMVYGMLDDYLKEKYPDNKRIEERFVRHYLSYLAHLLRAYPSFIGKKEFKDISNKLKNNDLILRKKTKRIKIRASDSLLLFVETRFPSLAFHLFKSLKRIKLLFKKSDFSSRKARA